MSVTGQILQRIKRAKPEQVFTRSDFLDLGSTHTVGMALHRLVKAGTLRRITRGLFDVPRTHPLLGKVSPRSDEVAAAIARRDGIRIQEGGASAANSLGMTEQVPAKIIYDTDGRSRKVRWGAHGLIEFKHRSTRKMAGAGRVTGVVISALANIGKVHVTEHRLLRLRRELKPEHKNQLITDLALAPVWMHKHIRYIAGSDETDTPDEDRS